MSVDALGNPLRFILTVGQEYDITQAHDLIAGYESEYVIADKGYESRPFRQSILERGMTPVVPCRDSLGRRKINHASGDESIWMLSEVLKAVTEPMKAVVSLIRMLPESWAVLFTTGILMLALFIVCNWAVTYFTSDEVSRSKIAEGYPYLRDIKPYLMASTTILVFLIWLFRWIKNLAGRSSASP